MKYLWDSLTKPPYRAAPWAVWLYVLACVLIQHDGGVFRGELFGFDDHVRMVQVLEWVNGKGWYDHTIMRANPPEGFTTIWSRIVDVPIAAVIVLAQQFMSQASATMVAAFVIPLVELAVLFAFAGPYFARPLVGKRKSNLIALFLLFTSIINFKHFSISGFFVGEASHRSWYVILDLLLFGAIARFAAGNYRLSNIMMLAGVIALLSAVGIEAYPMIAGSAFLLTIIAWSMTRPMLAARASDGFLCAALGALILLPLHQPPARLFTISFAEPSLLGPILIFSAALFLKIEGALLSCTRTNKRMSAIILTLVALLIATSLIIAFPGLRDGAAAGLSPHERILALTQHLEAQSVFSVSFTTAEFINLVMPTVIALVGGVYAVVTTRNRRRATAICYLGYAALAGFMSELYSRYYHHSMTTACAWLLWVWERVKFGLRKNRNYSLYALASFIAIGPLWMLLLPAIQNNAPITSQILMFPSMMQTVHEPCESKTFSDFINTHYSKKTLLLVPSWVSSRMLFETDVRIDFVANYPSHDKFIDNYAFFDTPDPDVARDIAGRHDVDLVAVCVNGRLYNGEPIINGVPAFALQLESGHSPAWLKRVKIDAPTNFILYAVDKDALSKETP